MDIGAWLRELGLERYQQAFHDNDIDAEVLGELTEADLERLGIGSLGHRKRLLKAIGALHGEQASAPPQRSGAAAARRETRSGAERRQLTVMFVDLVGSTELSARLDPEDMRDVITAYQECCAEVIGRFEGHVAKYMGDGVLAYFGYPRAHEDEAERAVRAGLELVGALAEVKAAVHPLSARVGIATGQVVVGDLIGAGAAQEQAVVGETPNLAARLQGLAPSGGVVIAPGTRRLLGDLFQLEDLGSRELKGFSKPVEAARVLAERSVESRLEAMRGTQLGPLVGREHELGLLLERWRRARDGEGQVVLLAGEAGIGKSRLLRALRERLAGEAYTALPHDGSPFHTSSALHPVIGLLERAAGLARDDSSSTRLAKLAALLAKGTDDLASAVPLVAALLGIDRGDRYPMPELTPQRQKQRTLEVLVERVRTLPALVLITHRPDLTPPWSGLAHLTQLSLSRLGRREGAAIAARVTGGKALPAEVLDPILARTEGVPLFVEELTKTVLESGLLTDAGDRYVLDGPLPPMAIPTTLHDSLMARLDRLAPVKEIAQIGAVIGRDFSHTLLAAVAERPEPELNDALDQLVAAELLFRRGAPPEATYSFKHALVQDAAYQSLLKSRRQQLHARIAHTLEHHFPAIRDAEPELLAHHYTEAGDAERAIGYWRAAARRASERSGHQEAVAHLGKGLELLRQLPETEERDLLELPIQISLGSAFVVIGGYASGSAEEAYSRARELAERLDEPAELFTATWGLWMMHQTRMRVNAGRVLADELLAVAQRDEDSGRRLEAHHAAWTTLLFVPELAACRRHAEEGLALYDPERHAGHKFRYGGHDAGVCGLISAGLAEWLLGFPDQALDRVRRGLSLGRDLEHGPSLAMALSLNSYGHRLRGELEAAHEMSEEQLRLCVEQGIFPQHAAFARIGRGWVVARSGDVDAGLNAMRQGLNELDATKVQFRRAYHVAMFGEICILAGRFDEARQALADALDTAERWWEPEVHRLRGDLVLAADAELSEEAGRHFRHALDLARAHESRSLELRAATSLARLWADRGERQKAHDLLAPIYGWFTEGFDTADLKDAKALLDQLR